MKKYLALLSLTAVGMAVSCGGDSSENMQVDCTQSSLQVSVESTTDAECATNGSIEVSSSGASGAVQYSINGTTFQTSNMFTVSAGTYTVTVKDKDCTATTQATVNPSGDAITITSVNSSDDAGCGEANASVTVTASGGVGQLMYRIDNLPFSEFNVFEGVSAGSHTITVTDDICTAQRTEKVLTGVSLENDIMPLLDLKCAFSPCHNGDNGAARNWTVKANVLANASEIKSRTQSGDMPRTGSLSQEQKDIIACWVDDGALDN